MTLVTGPLYERLKEIGQWIPSERTPYPPAVSSPLCAIAEALFWDERGYRRLARQTRVRYNLHKSPTAGAVSRFRIQWLIAFIFATLLVTMGVQLALLPLMIVYFHRVSLVSPLANILEGVLLSVTMAAGCLYLFAAGIFAPAGHIAAIGVDFAGHLLTSTVSWLGHSFPPSIRMPSLQGWAVILYVFYLLLFVLLTVMIARWNPLARRIERPRFFSPGPGLGYRSRMASDCFSLTSSSIRTEIRRRSPGGDISRRRPGRFYICIIPAGFDNVD